MRAANGLVAVISVALAACAAGCAAGSHGDDDGSGAHDDAAVLDGHGPGDGDAAALDAAVLDARVVDAHPIDATVDAAIDARPPIISGGPCISGAPGATAYRIRWTGGGGTAQVVYEVNGLPDHSRDHAGAYGYQIGFTPSFVDVPLGGGGLQLDGSDFVDLELTTAGLSSITQATLSIYGRSYNTTASGSFTWQTFDGVDGTEPDFVSNVAPYRWYSADMTAELSPGDSGVLIRIKAGPSSDSLSVARIELCLQAS
ncbi:MAG TPA: hypothetical protein VHE35_07915 [Kofleriaceae bacterium]|nr:hypothetical protein [Kofleriaceae bacterium]